MHRLIDEVPKKKMGPSLDLPTLILYLHAPEGLPLRPNSVGGTKQEKRGEKRGKERGVLADSQGLPGRGKPRIPGIRTIVFRAMKTLLSNKNLSRKKEKKKSINSIPRALRRYDLCSWSSHTQLQETAILLGCTPHKLLRKHDKALTFSNTKPQPPLSWDGTGPGPYHPSPTPMTAILKYCMTSMSQLL